jgi:hypothetical protein
MLLNFCKLEIGINNKYIVMLITLIDVYINSLITIRDTFCHLKNNNDYKICKIRILPID